MTVRAKLRLIEITETESPTKKVKFCAQYDSSIPEDMRFQKATPNGTIDLWIDNPAAIEQFKLGECYYVDFTPAPKQ